MFFVFYIVDGWPVEKLPGSTYSLCTLSSTFSIDGRREVDVPLWVVLGRSCGLYWRSWATLGAYVGGPGPLCWRSRAALSG